MRGFIKGSVCALVIFSFMSALPSFASLTAMDATIVWKKIEKATELSLPITVKQSEVPNAWVTNGERVTVTTGLLDLLTTRGELYGVLAHEAGHAVLNHHEETRNRATGLGLLSFILSRTVDDDFARAAAGVGAQLVYSGWSREEEIAADDFSVELAHRNGESMTGLYTAMMRMSKINKTEPSGFNSHPPDERRLLHIKNKIHSLDPTVKIPEKLPEEIAAEKEKAKKARTEASFEAEGEKQNTTKKAGADKGNDKTSSKNNYNNKNNIKSGKK